jgi:hypothetical protein
MLLKDDKKRSIQGEVIRHFEECAHLYRSIEPAPLLEGSIDLQFSFSLARCIRTAVGEFADLVVQALNAQSKRMTPRRRLEILEEALQLSRMLTEWPILRRWLALSMRVTLEETGLFSLAARAAFLAEVEGFRAEWVAEASRKIDLRCLLVASPTRPTRRQSEIKVLLRRAMEDRPSAPFREICNIVDGYYEKVKTPVPIPRSWTQPGVTGLASAYDEPQLNPLVRAYLSKIKRQFRP